MSEYARNQAAPGIFCKQASDVEIGREDCCESNLGSEVIPPYGKTR